MQHLKPKMDVTIGRMKLKNPVMTASGTFGYGIEYSDVVDLEKLGAIVVKGVSLHPWEGNPPPRLVETPSGLINSIGLQNPGVERFIAEYLPALRKYNTNIIVNVCGYKIDEYAEVAERLDTAKGVSGLELNVSCPNIHKGGACLGKSPANITRLVKAARKKTKLPLIVKLPPDIFNITKLARSAEDAGADALSLINTLPAMVIDVEKRMPVLGNVTGGLSGPAIHPVALKLVRDVAQVVHIPIIGMGGITNSQDALAFLIAGASAVAAGTACFINPGVLIEIIQGIERYLIRHKISSVKELTGTLRIPEK